MGRKARRWVVMGRRGGAMAGWEDIEAVGGHRTGLASRQEERQERRETWETWRTK